MQKMTYKFANFNSIKVQLEQEILHHRLAVNLFQFHKGTIRTFSPENSFSLVIGISIP